MTAVDGDGVRAVDTCGVMSDILAIIRTQVYADKPGLPKGRNSSRASPIAECEDDITGPAVGPDQVPAK